MNWTSRIALGAAFAALLATATPALADLKIGIAAEPQGLPRMPVFLAYALHDAIVPVDHALNFIKAMQQTGGQVDAHVFAEAPHGFALRDLNGTLAQWPDLAARWLDQRLPSREG